MMLGKLVIYMQKIKSRTLFSHPLQKQFKWIKDLKARPETLTQLQEKTGKILKDRGLGNYCLNRTPTAKETRERINRTASNEKVSVY
jgi:hypothetical protein